jgi:hypothetical protein
MQLVTVARDCRLRGIVASSAVETMGLGGVFATTALNKTSES